MVAAASAIPAQIKGAQAAFHDRMGEAETIIEGTKFHYDYVNGIYAGNFKNAQVVIGQAAEEQLQNERIREALVSAASLGLSFSPEGEAANLFLKIVEIAHKLDEVREKAEKLAKIAEAISGGEEKVEGGEGGPAAPGELQIMGLEHVIELHRKVAVAHNAGDRVLDGAVDLSTDIAANAPSSGAIDDKQSAALTGAAEACQELIAATDLLMSELRELQARRSVTIPSWREVEQDIWILYFASRGRIGTEQVLRNHMVDIGLWGPPGQPGGRLGVAEVIEGTFVKQAFEEPKVIPGHEDEEAGKSVGPQTLDWMQVVQGEAAVLPAKWRHIMLVE
jgi:hypothetical protein